MHLRNDRNVGMIVFGDGAISELERLIESRRHIGPPLIFIDHYFQGIDLLDFDAKAVGAKIIYLDTTHEPEVNNIDAITDQVRNWATPGVVVGIGGGSTLDTAKAVSNLLNNPGKAEAYQGWDLVKNSGVYKIGIPTISGTGAESSRTCVLTNYDKNLKLGMNSHHTIFDQLILDPKLTSTVSRDQYFYTGMDTYIHCIESLNGTFRHELADAYSKQALSLCEDIFSSTDMKSDEMRKKMMTASYFGGSALANSFVGVVHPLSAGLSMVLGTPHCLANCIVMQQMSEFYPEETEKFLEYKEIQGISIPSNITKDLDDEGFKKLHESSVIHEKPLSNALGDGFRDILSYEKTRELFEKM